MKLDLTIKKQVAAFQLDIKLRADAAAIALWGASGAGKTLTLNCIAGFNRPDAGRIMVGEDIFFDARTRVHVPPQKRRCGYLFQDHALFPHMTVEQNLQFAAAVTMGRRRPKIRPLLEALELGALANRKPAQLSGGQQQRAALARAMVSQPNLLLLDEPTQGLDARLKKSFFQLLKQMQQQSEVMIVLVTHDLDECFELGEYICLLAQGKVIQSGRKDDVVAKPESVEAARSLGIYNVIPAEIESLDPGRNMSRLRMLGAAFSGHYFPAHLIGDNGFAAFRQTAIQLSRNNSGVAMQVDAVKTYPSGVRLELEQDIAVLVSEEDAADVRVGGTVRINIAPSEIVFLSK